MATIRPAGVPLDCTPGLGGDLLGRGVVPTVAQGSTTLPVNFTADRSYRTSLSTTLLNAASTGTATLTGNSATNPMGQTTLTGTSATSNVFHIEGSDLALASGFAINALAGSTVVVDIDGATDSMQNFACSSSGVAKQHARRCGVAG